jgi:hypothetical protein
LPSKDTVMCKLGTELASMVILNLDTQLPELGETNFYS